jgi:hypothetical protein
MLGRVFSGADVLLSWGVGVAYLSAGVLVASLGPRAVFALVGSGRMLVLLWTLRLRGADLRAQRTRAFLAQGA